MFNAVLSPNKTCRAFPLTVATWTFIPPDAVLLLLLLLHEGESTTPSSIPSCHWTVQSKALKTASKNGLPHKTPWDFP
jgi:hypothetical protein